MAVGCSWRPWSYGVARRPELLIHTWLTCGSLMEGSFISIRQSASRAEVRCAKANAARMQRGPTTASWSCTFQPASGALPARLQRPLVALIRFRCEPRMWFLFPVDVGVEWHVVEQLASGVGRKVGNVMSALLRLASHVQPQCCISEGHSTLGPVR